MAVKKTRQEKWSHSACAMCISAPMKVKVSRGKITEVRGEDIPTYEGKLCGKALSGVQCRVYAPDRILYPLKRVGKRGEGKFTRCTWDEVIDATAAKLKEYTAAGHPEFFEIWWGCSHQADNISFLHYWTAVLKSGISYLHGQFCYGDNAAEKIITYGSNHMWALIGSMADLAHTKYAVIAGQNFPATAAEGGSGCKIPTYLLANKARENGCKFVSVDPKLADSTPWCDEWIPINPGGDNLFALVVARTLLKENLYDEDFLLKYTNAPQLLREDNGQALKDAGGRYLAWDARAKSAVPLPPASNNRDGLTLGLGETFNVSLAGKKVKCKTALQALAEEIQGYTIKDSFLAQKAVEVARELGRHKPSVIFCSGHTSGRYPSWFQAMRAYSVVNLLLGDIEQPGGLYIPKKMIPLGSPWPEPPEVPDYRQGRQFVRAPHGNQIAVTSLDKASCYSKPAKFHPATVALPWLHFNAIEEGKLRAVLSTAENAPVSQSNSKWVWECLKKLDLIVVGDQNPKEFVDLADYVLPEASYLERYHLYYDVSLGTDDKEHHIIYMRSAVIPPRSESKPVSWFLTEVAKKLGLEAYFKKDLKYDWWDKMLKNAKLYPKVTARKLAEEGPYVDSHPMEYNLLYAPISTRSGRFEIYSNELAEECFYNPQSAWQGNRLIYPLPVHVNIAEPKGDDEFYLLCGKAGWHQKSATQHDRALMEDAIEGGCPYSTIYVNTARAKKLGIKDGDLVEVECVGPTKECDPCVVNEAAIGMKQTAAVKLTDALHPQAAWVYFAAGHKSNSMLPKVRRAITHNWMVPTSVSPYVAGMGKNYSIVSIRKASETRVRK